MNDQDNICTCQDCLRKTTVFNHLTNEELSAFNASRYQTKYKSGEIIFKQGTAITHIMSFTKGLAKVYIEGYNNRDLILKLIKSGTLIGGPGVLVDNMHHFSVSAITDSTACFIDINEYKKALNNNTEFALAALKTHNTQDILSFNKFISLTQKQMQGRIADAILYLSEDIFGTEAFDMTISRQDLADLTAMSKESAIRIIKEFKDDKIISLNQNNLEILNMDKLKRFSEIG